MLKGMQHGKSKSSNNVKEDKKIQHQITLFHQKNFKKNWLAQFYPATMTFHGL